MFNISSFNLLVCLYFVNLHNFCVRYNNNYLCQLIRYYIFFFFLTDAGIDKKVFPFINEQIVDYLFEAKKCGFKRKFKIGYNEWMNFNSQNSKKSSNSSLLAISRSSISDIIYDNQSNRSLITKSEYSEIENDEVVSQDVVIRMLLFIIIINFLFLIQ